MKKSKAKRIRCHCSPEHCFDGTYCFLRPGGSCFAIVSRDDGNTDEYFTEFGCFDADAANIQCHSTKYNTHSNDKKIKCCNSSNGCNLIDPPTIPPPTTAMTTTTTTELPLNDSTISTVIFGFALATFCGLAVVIFILIYKFYTPDPEKYNLGKFMSIGEKEKSCPAFILSKESYSSQIVPQSYSLDDCNLLEQISEGTFGTLWKARTKNSRFDSVAIRYYSDQRFWLNEKTVLEKCQGVRFGPLRSCQQSPPLVFCLVTKYYRNGSLQNYLSKSDCMLNLPFILSLAHYITDGIEYLHRGYKGIPGKPPIAHCNLKTSNIMMYNGWNCIISDFSMAMIAEDDFLSVNDKLRSSDITIKPKTLRYFAPELLFAPNFRANKIRDATAADIYSLGLIIWEISSRCDLSFLSPDHKMGPYMMPYEKEFPDEPDKESLYKVIYEENARPWISDLWDKSTILTELRKIITESWSSNPVARLSALNMKKKLYALQREIYLTEDPRVPQYQQSYKFENTPSLITNFS